MDSVKTRQSKLRIKGNDIALLNRCERAWNNLDEFRQMRARAIRFGYLDQYGDTIVVNGKTMTYREYLMNTGNVVIQTNQIKNKVETIVGNMVKDKRKPVCHAIDRDEQSYGEIMTTALQTNCDKNQFGILKSKWLKELCYGGMAVGYESYDDVCGPSRVADSWSTYLNPNSVFFESEVVDPRYWDFSLVGRIFPRSFEALCAQFARTPEDYGILRQIYASQSSVYKESEIVDMNDKIDYQRDVFMHSGNPTECWVCEVWTKETRPKIRLYDTNDTAPEEIIDVDDYAYRKLIREENEKRRRLAKQAGWDEDEVPYIIGDGFGSSEEEKNGFFIETYWYCRFLAPDGTILWEGESPYADGLHPFTFCIFPFIDGKIVGYENDAIDMNLAINRALVLHDWLVRTQAKGVTVVPKKIVPDDTDFDQFARSWTSIDDLVYIDMEPGQEGLFPRTFYGAAQNFDVAGLIATYSRLLESGTAVNGALQGKAPNSGTSGILYEQMVANSSTPIAALMEDFSKFIESVLNKKMKNIAKFYTPERFRKIAGKIDGLENVDDLNLNEVGDLEYDLVIKESADTPVFRAAINQDAKEFVMNGLISFDEYLEIADVPYADKILQSRQARQAEMEEQQRQAASGMSPEEQTLGEEPVPVTALPAI